MSDIPKLYLILIAPLPELLSLELPGRCFLVGFGLVGDKGVEVVIGSKEGDDLSRLVLDDYGMGRVVLLLVKGENVVLLRWRTFQVVHLDVSLL